MKTTRESSARRTGQSLVEYGVIIALVVIVVIVALASLGRRAVNTMENTTTALGDLGTEVETEPEQAVHVAAIELEVHFHHDHVRGRVFVFDQDGTAVSGASVNVDWFVNGTSVTSQSGGTGSDGKASFALGLGGIDSGDVVRIVVTNVTASGHEYDSGSNVESEKEIVVP